jgi:hypothetical protein
MLHHSTSSPFDQHDAPAGPFAIVQGTTQSDDLKPPPLNRQFLAGKRQPCRTIRHWRTL